jgi:hypothetical protein
MKPSRSKQRGMRPEGQSTTDYAAPDNTASSLLDRMNRYRKTLKEFFYGMTVHEMHMEFKKEKHDLNNLFMLVVFGDLAGLPLLPPYYSMRLLPYIVPHIAQWKRSILREKDITDIIKADI